ncbi:hypothetical protein WDU94_013266 [Cyamophila willieti]
MTSKKTNTTTNKKGKKIQEVIVSEEESGSEDDFVGFIENLFLDFVKRMRKTIKKQHKEKRLCSEELSVKLDKTLEQMKKICQSEQNREKDHNEIKKQLKNIEFQIRFLLEHYLEKRELEVQGPSHGAGAVQEHTTPEMPLMDLEKLEDIMLTFAKMESEVDMEQSRTPASRHQKERAGSILLLRTPNKLVWAIGIGAYACPSVCL